MKTDELPQSVRLALQELKAALINLYGERLGGRLSLRLVRAQRFHRRFGH